MTIPSLMNNYQRQTYVAQLHKVYTEMSQALLQYQTERNAVNLKEAGLNSNAAFAIFIRDHYKIVQDCGTDMSPCFVSLANYKKMSGSTLTSWVTPRNHVVIASGSSIGYMYRPQGEILFELYVDVNGAKGPNIVGRDLFPMFVYNNGMIDDSNFTAGINAPMSRDDREANFATCQSNDSGNWHGCFGKIINDNWQMTY